MKKITRYLCNVTLIGLINLHNLHNLTVDVLIKLMYEMHICVYYMYVYSSSIVYTNIVMQLTV